MEEFIHVFGEASKEKLLLAGFELFKEDARQRIYTFLNKSELDFSLKDVQFVRSSTLTF